MSGWREFTTQAEAQDYCDQCWAGFCYKSPINRYHAAQAHLKPTNPAHEMSKAEWALTKNVKIKSVNHLGAVVEGADSTAWAIPMITKAGKWAVPVPDEDPVQGGPVPEWPDPVPLP